MKKILFFGGLLLSAMTFVSCNDDFADWTAPQSNPQEEAVTLPGYTATGTAAVDLAEVTGDRVQILTLSEVALPEGSTTGNTRIELAPADAPDAAVTTIDVDNDGTVAKADLQAAIETFWGKRPSARTMTGHVYSDIITEGQSFLVDAGVITVTATPEAPFIASAYYIVGDVTGGWDADHVVQFSHSDADVYEDPVFTVTFTAAAGNCWQIIPQNNIDNNDFWHKGADGVVGVAQDGDPSLSGTLVATEGVGAGKIEVAGTYRMTINMMDYTYTIESMASTYYLVGALQGWTADEKCVLYPITGMQQSYTTCWTGDGNLKLWPSDGVGNWDTAFGAAMNDDQSVSGQLIANTAGAGNIKVPTVGEYYTFTADFSTMTYTWTRLDNQNPTSYNSIGIVGDFTTWAKDADVLMTEVTPHNWYASGVNITAGGVKFRVDGGWDVNWGGDTNIADQNYGTGVSGGGNLTVPDGTYSVYFNDITAQFVFVAE